MYRLISISAAVVAFSAGPVVAQLNSTVTIRRSPTFTRSAGYLPTSTINSRSPTFMRSSYNYGYYDYYGPYRSTGRLSYFAPSPSPSGFSVYRSSVFSSGRGLDASRGLYGASGYRTYASPW